ncbi:MAG: glycosyl hydrolase [Acidobacteria bacterium]|nr:MAG: glycosyl hydrolase [Acidobacteriota bacterium]
MRFLFRLQRSLLLAACAGLALTPLLPAQQSAGQALASLRFRAIGPAIQGGRVDDIAVSAQNPNVIYIGTANGGLWKSSDGGNAWAPVFDGQTNLSIGAVAVAPSNPAIVWAGTGEANNRQSATWGNGVYRSLDGGRSWQHMGLDDTQSIGRIAIDPSNPQVVYVAALGHLWGANPQRGLFKTSDGGKTWQKVLFLSENTGVSDVRINPQSPNIVYAAAYERRRTPWGFDGGGPEGGVYRSLDGGATWAKLANGLPDKGPIGRIGLAIYAQNPNIVYALIESEHSGLFRSDDGGNSWTRMSSVDPRPSYFSQIRVDPSNDLRLWMGGVQLRYSTDGGKNWTTDRNVLIHPDFHAIWIDPRDSHHVVVGCDGGVFITRDRGRHWYHASTMPLGQAYEVSYDDQRPYHVCAGLQDNAVWCAPNRVLNNQGILNSDWKSAEGGDGFYVAHDPRNPDVVYAEMEGGNLTRRNLRTGQFLVIQPQPPFGQPRYRFNWDAPLIVSNQAPGTLFFGASRVFKSTDAGNTWTPLGSELTTKFDRDKAPILGQIPSRKTTLSLNDGVSAFPTLTELAQSPLNAQILWAGTDDGNLQVSRDGGQTWANVIANLPGVPKGTWVSRIEASRTAPGTAYVAFDGHRSDDLHPYLYKTTDYGQSWTSLSGGIPAAAGSIHVIREDPSHPNVLFAGAQFGGFVSLDGGATWSQLRMGLPSLQVDDIQVQPRQHDLILATHGRSIYILDDILALENMTPQTLAEPMHLFPIRAATEWIVNGDGWFSAEHFAGPNPPDGAILDLYLAAAPAAGQSAKIEITDAGGKPVRTLTAAGLHAGINRIIWDFRRGTAVPQSPQSQPGFATYPAPNTDGGGRGYDGSAHGIMVPPGLYSVHVQLADRTASQTVEMLADPRITLNPAAEAARQALWLRLDALYAAGIQARDLANGIQTSLKAVTANWKPAGGDPAISPAIQDQAKTIATKLDAIQSAFISQRGFFGNGNLLLPAIAELMGKLEYESAAPPAQQPQRAAALAAKLGSLQASLHTLTSGALPQLNTALNKAGIPRVLAVPKAPSPRPNPF